MSFELQQEVEAIAKEENGPRGDGEKLKFTCIPVGIKKKLGTEGLMKWWKETLSESFGVVGKFPDNSLYGICLDVLVASKRTIGR